ncbi:hypothetical protein GCM10028819_41800 [Spirosoma humi]
MFSLGVPFWGTYTILQSQKKEVKEEVAEQIRKGIDANEIVLLKFSISDSKKQLHWEHDWEFEYKGQMYDLIETTVNGDSIRYKCLWDKEETRLNRQLETLMTWVVGSTAEAGDSDEQFIFLKPLYYQELTHWQARPSCVYVARARYYFTKLALIRIALSPPLLPPES